MTTEQDNILIAYYSRDGNNFVGGEVVDLSVGNTEVIAQMIAGATGGELFEIKTVEPYPADYHETTEVTKNHKRENLRPELSSHVENIDDYDIIFLGFPNWWGTMPMPVFTFLEEYNFTGKTIIPFCTHEGSGMGRSQRDIAKLCPETNILNALSVHGAFVHTAKSDVEKWIIGNLKEMK